MADGMTKGEIEDVLSSIRRLVSDGNRPVFRAAPRPFAREAEKLILTPALRVPPHDDGQTAPPTRFVLTQDAQPARPSLGTVVSAIAAAVPPQVQGWESETGDPVEPIAASPGAVAWIDDLAARRIASLDPSDPPADPLADATAGPVGAADTASDALPWEDTDDDDGWEADEDAAVPHVADPVMQAANQDHGPRAPALSDQAVPVVDAAILTEMIREVLREELRGPFGTRITANLRRLVRAEIARALTLRAED